MAKKYAYYPGCSSAGTSKEYDVSTRAVCKALGVELVDIPDWSCCGSTPAHQVDQRLSAALSARNLAQAEALELEQILTPCPSCLKNLHNAQEHMDESPAFKASVDALTQRPLTKRPKLSSVLQAILEDVTPETIAKMTKKPLKGLKLVAYYGCLMTRPARSMHFDDEENPTSLDRIMEAAGATMLPFPLKIECCGGSFGIPRNDVTARLGGRIMEAALEAGADAVVVACPLCQMNLDLRQRQINSANGLNLDMPVFYFTQLLGLAFDLPAKSLELGKLVVDVKPALDKIGKEEQADKAAAAPKAVSKEEAGA